MTPANTSAPDHDTLLERACAALENVTDPEIPVVTIGELGILRAVRRAIDDPAVIEVVITPTYSGCPAMSQIADDVGFALNAAGIGSHRITTVWAPAWTTDWITAAAREKLRRYGIAPPGSTSTPAAQPISIVPRTALRGHFAAIACPRCGSSHTNQLSAFSSTACKALYRCLDCQEAFDYFKPY